MFTPSGFKDIGIGKKGFVIIVQFFSFKATLNGRVGVIVSGGISGKQSNMTSVEFYDAETGSWYTLPSLRSHDTVKHCYIYIKGNLFINSYLSKNLFFSRCAYVHYTYFLLNS